MSDENANPSARPDAETPDAETPDAETPVGDMTEEGETELGPYPSLANVENWEESDIEDAAGVEDEELPE